MGRRVAARGSFMVHESPLSPGSDIRAGTGERPSLVGSRRSRIRMLGGKPPFRFWVIEPHG
jgi:hypothetical protein